MFGIRRYTFSGFQISTLITRLTRREFLGVTGKIEIFEAIISDETSIFCAWNGNKPEALAGAHE